MEHGCRQEAANKAPGRREKATSESRDEKRGVLEQDEPSAEEVIPDDTQNDRAEELTAEYISEMTAATIKMEQERSDSLQKLSGTMLTCTSILSVGLLTIAEPLFNGLPSKRHYLLVAYLAVFMAIAVAFVLALLSQWRMKYRVLDSPKSLCKAVEEEGLFSSPMDVERNRCDSLEGYYDSIHGKNEKACTLLMLSIVATVAAVIIIVLATIALA